MPRNLAHVQAGLALAGLLLLPCPAAAETDPCPPPRPTLSGPPEVYRTEPYSVFWTNVLASRGTSSTDFYVLERSEDPAFAAKVERIQTTRSSLSWSAPGGLPRILYHRVVVQSSCAGADPVRVESAVLPVKVTDHCRPPVGLGAPTADPPHPPALTMYVVSWNAPGSGEPGFDVLSQGLRYRLRRNAAGEVTESVHETTRAAFADVPGLYTYEVRTENVCGDVSAWSERTTVVVGTTKTASLVLVAAPRPVFVSPGVEGLTMVPFTVRNAGSEPLDVTGRGASPTLTVVPASFHLEPGEAQTVKAAVPPPIEDSPFHGSVTLQASGVSLRVAIDAALAGGGSGGGAPAGTPGSPSVAGWDEDAVDVDRAGSAVTRNLSNPGSTTAVLGSTISADWLIVTAEDGKPWDRPLEPGETRAIRLQVDRTRRRAAIGTEVAAVTVVTAGHPDEPRSLSVIDDGPQVTGVGSPADHPDLPPLYSMKSRLLFPSLPNAVDARGSGRYTSDVWLSNVDALSPIQVVMTLTPAGQAGTSSSVRQFAFTLGPGEIRRFRNLVGTVFDYEGGCSLDIASPSPTLSATALVNNKPLAPLVAGRTAALGTAAEGTLLSTAEFGFEMRPVAPGEGASFKDPTHVVSGLWHDARRRTNLILRETTGNETVVRVQLFDGEGNPVLRDGSPVDREFTVPAQGSLQVNDADLFPSGEFGQALRAQVEFQRGTVDSFGQVRGAVAAFATVIDSGTQDAALRVGTSERALTPASSGAGTQARLQALPTTGLPYDGGPEPLLFPVSHVTGATLSSGAPPRWRSRVTFSNVSSTEQRNVRLRFRPASGAVPAGMLEQTSVVVPPGWGITFDDILEQLFGLPAGGETWGTIEADNLERPDGSWLFTWSDVDVQTETYTADTENPTRGEYRTGMEGYSYQHGYSSFQSNLGTVLIDGAETSARNRTNLILQEVGGAPCAVIVGVYRPGSLVPIAMANVSLKAGEYVSRELFRDLMKLDLEEVVDARVVVRQLTGDGVFMAFVSKINLVTGDPANVFLRPASAGTGR